MKPTTEPTEADWEAHQAECDAQARRTTPEVTFEIVPKDITLPPEEKQSLITSFSPLLAKARELLEESKGIKSAKLARVSRLGFRKLRGDSEALRKSLKEHHLRMGKAIDGAHAILVAAVSEEEKRMDDIEKAEERAEEERIEALRQTRHDLLVPLGVHESIANSPGLGRMADDAFAGLLADSKAMHEARLERERKAEEERLAKEVAEAQERERIRLENERLLKEAAEREEAARIERERAAKEKAELEAKLEAERKEAEAKLAAERAEAEKKAEYERQAAKARQDEADAKAKREKDELEAKHKADQAAAQKKLDDEKAAREKLETEAKAKQEAEDQKKREAEEAAERAALAPDKEKLIAMAAAIRKVPVPKVKAKKATAALTQFITKLNNLADWIEEKAGEL